MLMQQLLLSAITVDNYVKASGLQHTSEISECMYIDDDIAFVFINTVSWLAMVQFFSESVLL